MKRKLKVIDLFCGVGGLSFGFAHDAGPATIVLGAVAVGLNQMLERIEGFSASLQSSAPPPGPARQAPSSRGTASSGRPIPPPTPLP